MLRGHSLRAFAGAIAIGISLGLPVDASSQAKTSDSCAAADALRAADEPRQARRDYLALLRGDPQLECAKKGLEAVNAPVPDKTADEAQQLCDLGDAYSDAHRNDDALAAYKSALAKDPSMECATSGVSDAGPSMAGRWMDAVADAIPQYLLAGALLLLLFFLFLLPGHHPKIHGVLVQIPILSRVLSPRLTLESFKDQSDKKVSETIEARIKERLTRMREEATRTNAPDYALDFGTPREDFAQLVAANGGLKSALDKASEATEHTKLVGAVLNVVYTLLPIRRLTVAGVVEPAAGPTASATLSLETSSSLTAAATLLGPAPAAPRNLEASDYVKLADPAAVWVQYEVARALQGGKNLMPDAAESYALVREGLDRQLAGDYPQARTFYERALELDPDNWAARVNLATTEVRSAQNYDRAIDVLEPGLRSAEGP